MPIVEEMKGRGGTDKNLSRKYTVSGTSSEADVLDALYETAPNRIAGLPLQGFTIDEDKDLDQFWFCEAQYGQNEKDEPEEDAVEYRFSYQAPSFQIQQSLQTISMTPVSGGTAENHKGAINVVEDSLGKKHVEGYSLSPPPVTFTLAYYPANAVISSAYQMVVENLVGKVNSTAFKGRPAGSLLLASAQGGARNNAGWSIDFGFAYLPNLTSIPVGDITVPAKDGMDLLWVQYKNDVGAKELIAKPVAAYVERVFYRAEFNVLGL